MVTCPTCGGYTYVGAWYGIIPPRMCSCRTGPMVGWQCPACGEGNSPWVARCGCRPLLAPIITCTVTFGAVEFVSDVTTGYRDLVLMQ